MRAACSPRTPGSQHNRQRRSWPPLPGRRAPGCSSAPPSACRERPPQRLPCSNRWLATSPGWRRCSSNWRSHSAKAVAGARRSQRCTTRCACSPTRPMPGACSPITWTPWGIERGGCGPGPSSQGGDHRSTAVAAASALVANRLPLADARLSRHLERYPTDVAALRMQAELAGGCGDADAERLLERCLELAPSFDAARHNYASLLNRQGKPHAALPAGRSSAVERTRNPAYRSLKAAILANLGDYTDRSKSRVGADEYPAQPRSG